MFGIDSSLEKIVDLVSKPECFRTARLDKKRKRMTPGSLFRLWRFEEEQAATAVPACP
jgi:hypothetical protein